ncbi:MAG: ATP-binding protein [Candidatus Hodarchaeota archaeon]
MTRQYSRNYDCLTEFIPINQVLRLFESISDPVFTINKDLRIVYVNKALVQKLESLNLVQLVMNKTIYEAFSFLSNTKIEEYIQVFQSGVTLITKDSDQIGNNIFHSETYKIPIFVQGKIKYILTIVRDIPSPMKVQENTRISGIKHQSDIYRKRFIETTTHELRTPLTNIKGFIEILYKYKEKITQDKKKNIFKVLEKNIKRLELLVNDISDVSKLEQDSFRLDKKEVNFGSFFLDEMSSYKKLLGDLFEYKLRPDNHELFPKLSLDVNRIHQIFDNIINNAIKQSPKETLKISVQATLLPEHIRIRFTDNGVGIATENIERIFEQFVSIPTKFSVTGTGIGLYVSRMIIEKHGGTIKAKSEGLDKGASFIIDLPIH